MAACGSVRRRAARTGGPACRVPGALSMSNRPPSSVSRSRMLNSPQPTWPAFARSIEPCRVEPDPLVGHGDAELVVARRVARSTVTRSTCACLTALNSSSRTDSNSSVRTSFRAESASGSARTWTTSLYLSRVRSPARSAPRAIPSVQHGRKQLEAQRSCGGDRFVEVTFRLGRAARSDRPRASRSRFSC